MDAQQFDRLTQRLNQALSRPPLFGAVLAVLGLGASTTGTASAKPKKGKKKKRKPKACAAGTKCGNACVDTQNEQAIADSAARLRAGNAARAGSA